jgi:RHS repeat-associated protein
LEQKTGDSSVCPHITSDGSCTPCWTYDDAGQLTSGNGASYLYDGVGRRQQKTDAGGTVHDFVFDGSVPYTEFTSAGFTRQTGGFYTYANNSTYFPRSDHLGTPRVTTDYTGSVQRTETNLAFGDGFSETASPFIDFTGFAGGFWDSENNADHFGAREYVKTQGRWLTPDPAGLAAVNPWNPQTWNRYAYVGNSPVTYNDPLGLKSPECPLPGGCGLGNALGFFAGAGGGAQCASNAPGGQITITLDGMDAGCNTINSIVITGGASNITITNPITGGPSTLPSLFLTAGGGACQLHGWRGEDTWYVCFGGSFTPVGGLGSSQGPPQPATPSIPHPPDPILAYDKCSTTVQQQAESNADTIDILSGIGMGNAALGCIGTGPLWPECEGTVASVEGLVTAVNWGAKQKSIWDGQTACMQGP